jgi:hypothetical protein
MFILFVMRQWGQKLNKDVYVLLGLGLIVLVEQELINQYAIIEDDEK